MDSDAARVVSLLTDRGWTVATGESLTAGLVTATLAEVPGCSAVLRGGVVAYHADLKSSLLGVTDAELAHGVVSAPVALGLARGAARVLGADVGIGTTGVAGPEAHDGSPVGSVWIAAWWPGGEAAQELALAGDRAAIRAQATAACLDLVLTRLVPAE